MNISEKDAECVKQIKEAVAASGVGYVFASESSVASLVAAGLVELNRSIGDDEGNFAIRLSKKAEQLEFKSSYAYGVESGVAMPGKSTGKRTSQYPFDALEVGQSFFVASSIEKPDPAKSLASAVCNANKRCSGIKKFAIRRVDGGARIWRTE